MFSRLNWIDIVIIILLFRTTYVGFSRGLTKVFFNFVGLIVATCVSIHYYGKLGEFLTNNLDFLERSISILISFILLVAGSILAFKIIIFLISKLVQIDFAVFLEKIGGLIIGIVYGLLLSSLLLIILSFSKTEYIQSSLSRSFSVPFIIKIAPKSYDFILKVLPIESSEARENIKTEFIKE
jgi:uncharacterized membrane protein required for colicin V production